MWKAGPSGGDTELRSFSPTCCRCLSGKKKKRKLKIDNAKQWSNHRSRDTYSRGSFIKCAVKTTTTSFTQCILASLAALFLKTGTERCLWKLLHSVKHRCSACAVFWYIHCLMDSIWQAAEPWWLDKISTLDQCVLGSQHMALQGHCRDGGEVLLGEGEQGAGVVFPPCQLKNCCRSLGHPKPWVPAGALLRWLCQGWAQQLGQQDRSTEVPGWHRGPHTVPKTGPRAGN